MVMTTSMDERIRTLHYLLREAVKINAWRIRVLHALLSNLAPRIDALSNRMYMGCGFHYDMLQQLGSLINAMAIHFQPSMNWLDKNVDEHLTWIALHVKAQLLFRAVAEAEASANTIAKEGLCP